MVTAAILFAAYAAWQAAVRRDRRPPVVRAVPAARTRPPAVAPTILIRVPPEDARALNAAVPFVAGPLAAARPFRFAGAADEREKALTCLASAAWYEAGDDAPGERAVVQVVLNRVRHPAFPKTVCGVVFQGSERSTGCQFTFTCDGALARQPSPAAWDRARHLASVALDGAVAKNVGMATHYHTDWVIPYWRVTLDKIAAVRTHLFYRWKGWWGTPGAFRGRYGGAEPFDRRIAWLSRLPPDAAVSAPLSSSVPALSGLAALPDRPLVIEGLKPSELKGSTLRLMDLASATFVLQLAPAAFPGSYAVAAVAICRGRPACTVIGYLRPDWVPATLPVADVQLRRAAFVYRRRINPSRESTFWDCRQVVRDEPRQCAPGTEPMDCKPS